MKPVRDTNTATARLEPRHTRSLAAASVLALTVALTGNAMAQQNQSEEAEATAPRSEALTAEEQQLEEIRVTGTRIRRSGFESPNPLTVLDNEYMENLGIVNISDVVADIPQNEAYVTPRNVALGNFNVGASLANLRGLNPYFGTRTLTLVDGRRHVPSTNGGAVDLNLIPSLLVARTEVVTGGASAAYGTDAVAGVVNLILDKSLTGIKMQADYGQTFRSDGTDFHAGFAAGTDYADGRGHVVIGGEYQDVGKVGDCADARQWCAESWTDYTNNGFAANDDPNFVIGPNAKSPNQTGAGVFPGVQPFAPGLANKQFNDAGTAIRDFDPGKYVPAPGFLIFNGRQGGDGDDMSPYESLPIRVPLERYTIFGHTDYELTDDIEVFLEASYGKRESTNVGWAFGGGFETIEADNAFLPEDVAAQIPDFGWAFFNRNMLDLLRQTNFTENETYRVVTGAEGELGGSWTWDAYYQYGRNDQTQRLHNNQVTPFFEWSIDAVYPYAEPGNPDSGINTSADPVCRVTRDGLPAGSPNGHLSDFADDCVPLNLFGRNNANEEALAFSHRTLMEDFVYQQHVAAANVTGDLFEGWGAGPIQAAFGAEYRFEKGNVTHGNQPFYDQFALSYNQDFAGKLNVIEGYGELNVPIARNVTAIDSLEVNGAIRQTHTKNTNKLTGASQSFDITSWKASLTYNPIEAIRLRATRSRDLRAPGFRELYIREAVNPEGAGLAGSVTNPWTNMDDPTASVGGGNVDLLPEKANTTTIGAVFQPEGALQGLRFSADWFEIELNDAIDSGPGLQSLVDLCFEVGQYCDRIEGTPDGMGGFANIDFIDNRALNRAALISRGMDFELDYLLTLNRVDDDWNGSLNFRSVATYMYDFIVDSGLSQVDYAGQSGPQPAFTDWNSMPHWVLNNWISYSNGGFTGTVQGRYIGPGKYNVQYTGPQDPGYDPSQPNSINDNRVDDRLYITLSANYRIPMGGDRSVEVFGVINNLFDRDPPVAPGGNGFSTNPVYFDTLGARFRAGVRLRY